MIVAVQIFNSPALKFKTEVFAVLDHLVAEIADDDRWAAIKAYKI
jgi:hypothetical protein